MTTVSTAACYHYLKKRDTRPGLVATLLDVDLTAYDLTGADEAWMHVRLDDGTTFSRQMTFDADRTTGKLSYLWQATDWTTGDPVLYVGEHRIEYEVIGPGAVRATFPNRDLPELRHILSIGADIGQET